MHFSAHDEPGRLTLGGVAIEFDAQCLFPIAVDHRDPDGARPLVTVSPITYRYGELSYTIPRGYVFDGATIPLLFRWVPGLRKIDWSLLATLIHDYACDHPEKIPRPVGDGIFVSVLLALAERRVAAAASLREKTMRRFCAWAMYAAVSCYTVLRALAGARVQRLLWCLAAALVLTTAFSMARGQTMEDAFDATCRVTSARGSTGTGTIFAATAEEYEILTNAHVVDGGAGARVECEFWLDGYQSQRLPGEVADAWLDQADIDIAVVRVARRLFPRDIAPLPLATAAESVANRTVYSVGCANGTWPTGWKGHVLAESARAGVVHFVPPPAGGRSGSGIFAYVGDDADKRLRIVGLIAWRSEDDSHGIAMHAGTIRQTLSGGAGTRPDRPQQTGGGRPVAWRDSPPPAMPPGFECQWYCPPNGNCPPPDDGWIAPRRSAPGQEPGSPWGQPSQNGEEPQKQPQPDANWLPWREKIEGELKAIREDLGRLPAGPAGPPGEAGPAGPPGPPGQSGRASDLTPYAKWDDVLTVREELLARAGERATRWGLTSLLVALGVSTGGAGIAAYIGGRIARRGIAKLLERGAGGPREKTF